MYILVFILVFQACGKSQQKETEAVARPVKYVRVQALGNINKLYTGTVEAEEFSVLAFKLPGRLVALNVERGQQVEKGQTVARIDPVDYELSLATAQANYETTKSIYERNLRLIESAATSQENVEIAQANFVQATSGLNFARTNLENTRLTAPFTGIVEMRYVENYEEVQVGQPVIKLVNPNNLFIRFMLPETNTVLMDIPKRVYVEFDTDRGHWYEAEIKEYIYASNGIGIPVTLRLIDPDAGALKGKVFPGFSCRVKFRIENMIAGHFLIPESALMKEGDAYYVWIINPKTLCVNRREVGVTEIDNRMFVDRGLSSSDMIVTAGIGDLREAQKVSL